MTRRKVGRAYLYQANLTADEARLKAVEKIVAGFFDGSADALAAHLGAPEGGTLQRALSPLRRPLIVDAPGTLGRESLAASLDETLL